MYFVLRLMSCLLRVESQSVCDTQPKQELCAMQSNTAFTDRLAASPDHLSLFIVATGPTLDVPHTVTPQQLEVLLNGLLQNEEKMPYSFYIEGQVHLPAWGLMFAASTQNQQWRRWQQQQQ